MIGEEGYVMSADDVRLYYHTVGSGPSPVVIPAACMLAGELDPLAEGRTLIYYDTRGRGRSEAVADPTRLTLAHEIADLEAIRRHFGLERFALLGWSYLGAVTALHAVEHPSVVARLLLIGPMRLRRGRYPGEDPAVVEGRVDPARVRRLEELRAAGLEADDPAAYCREWQRVYLPRQMGRPTALARMKNEPCALPNEWGTNVLRTLQALGRSWGAWDWRPQVASLGMPALVLQGAEDATPLASARDWVETLGNARLLVLPEVGHFPWLEDPDAFFPPAEQFLAGAWPQGAERSNPSQPPSPL